MSQMSPAVNFLDPVTPSAAMAVRDTGDHLMRTAELNAQTAMAKAKLETDKMISKAQIDATASEHGKYQDFLMKRDAAEAATRQKEEQTRFEHELEVNKQANEFMTKQQERVRNLEISKQKAHVASLVSRADAAEALAKSRAASADELTEAEANIASAQAAYGADRDTLIKLVGGTLSNGIQVKGDLQDLVLTQINGLNASETYGLTASDEALRAALDKLAVGEDIDESFAEYVTDVAGENFVTGMPLRAGFMLAGGSTNKAMKDLAFAKGERLASVLANETATQLADRINAKGGNADPNKVKQILALALDIKQGADGGAAFQAKLANYKQLHNELTQGDPLKGTEITYALRGLDKAIGSMTAETVKTLMKAKAGEEKGFTVGQINATLEALGRLKGVSSVPGSAGVSEVTKEGLAITVDKLARYVGGEQHALEVLPPELQILAADFYRRKVGDAGGQAAARVKLSEERLRAATAKKGKLDLGRGLLDQELASGAARKEAEEQQMLLDAMRAE